ncbi:MAG: UTP--glucose-1-phosphate uridylyltransferase [Actinomycetota bacterium]|nr:UTP--glucose-1-phosphate uridylyltransferase [Actinomycetota bacterium]
MNDERLKAAEEKMRAADQPEEAIRNFRDAGRRLVSGESVLMSSADLEPARDIPVLADLPSSDEAAALEQFALIKLNGGLATTMGLRAPKSLLPAREGRSFLDIIIGQTLSLRRQYDVSLPLILMNSQATQAATVKALAEHPELNDGLPTDFLQSMIPKLDAETFGPVSWPADPSLEYCPPGHGDVYGALRRSGMLAALLERGCRFAMISNSDNLGATLDPRIAAYVAEEEIPFLMEVVEGTEAERKGGHIARRRADGQLVLRESAQTPTEDEDSFRDYRRWRYYNTNNLWVDLRALSDLLEERGGVLPLPLIVNRKTVDPRDSSSTPVLQLESAMGAAIESFPESRLLCGPRTRFVPVKTTDDLLILRSDVYTLTPEMLVEPVPERGGELPFVELDKGFYRLLEKFDRRFPAGAPSLREASRLVVHGDVTFGRGVIVRGAVDFETDQPITLADGTVLGE